MFREIKKKLLILENRRPWPPQAAAYIDEMNRTDWIYAALHYDDPAVTRESILRISKGEFVEEASVSQHVAVENYRELLRLAYNMAAMKADPDRALVEKFQAALLPDRAPSYRQSNPVLLYLDYNPPHFQEIDEQLGILFRQLAAEDFSGNPILKAAWLHHRLIEVFPLSEGNEAMARNLMYYQLLREGYPPFILSLSEQEYYAAIRQFFKTETIAPMYDAMERSLYNKVEVMLQLTAQ